MYKPNRTKRAKRTQQPPKTEINPPLATWTMFPTEHENVSLLLSSSNLAFTFYTLDTDQGSIRTYDTNITGLFPCNNTECKSRGWGSKRVAITIRLFPGEKYNARVYYQRCMKCDGLSEPKIDDSYAERVVYRLKKWKGVEQEAMPYGGKSNAPHVESLCEGCKDGHCSQGKEGVDGLVRGLQGFGFGGSKG